jgi:hypothetical protein
MFFASAQWQRTTLATFKKTYAFHEVRSLVRIGDLNNRITGYGSQGNMAS